MANFNTHLIVAISASSITAIALYTQNILELLDIPWFIFLGMIGGLLPDIDSDHSRPLKLLFTALAMLVALFTTLIYKDQYILQLLFIIAGSAFIIVRYFILAIFKRFTVHRGVFHSLLAVAFFTLFTVYISHNIFHYSIHFSWMNGLFIGLGFIIHLSLDEIFSVDLANAQLKRSFGTALKLFSRQSLTASFVMLILCALLYFNTPTLPFEHQEAFTIVNLALDASNSTVEKYFFKLTW